MRILFTSCCVLSLLLPAFLGARPARADDDIAPEDLREKALAASSAAEGWKANATFGSTFSFNQSSSVVGSPDGVSLQLGLLVDGQAAYVSGRHTWTSTLKGVFSESKTPVLDRFVKSSDGLDLTTTYTFRLEAIKWIGPYARGRFSTQMAPGYLVKPADYKVKWQQTDGSSTVSSYGAQEFVQLTGAFDPMLIGESVGLFANPTESEAVTVKLKLGVGTQQLISSWGYALVDDAKTPEVEVKAIHAAVQAGGEAEAQAYGQVSAELKWKAKASFFMPVYTSITGTPTGLDALNSDFSVSASYKLAKWLSLDYVFSAKRVPLVSDKWQVQNGAVVTAGFNL